MNQKSHFCYWCSITVTLSRLNIIIDNSALYDNFYPFYISCDVIFESMLTVKPFRRPKSDNFCSVCLK